MKTDFYTMGVYGLTIEQFFEKILLNNIDTFIDIRRRRAVRGSKYSFVNSNRLQLRLKELGINYIHILDLSPTNEIRAFQKTSDKFNNITKIDRDKLDDRFVLEYKKNILDLYNFSPFFEQLDNLKSKRAMFFCVESKACACHRSIITEKLEKEYSFKIIHL